MLVPHKNYIRSESRNGSERAFLGSTGFSCCGTSSLRRPSEGGRHPEDLQARGTSRAPPLRKDLSGSETRGAMLLSADWPQVRQRPGARRLRCTPYVKPLSHPDYSHGYPRLLDILLQPLLQLHLQLFDGEPSCLDTVYKRQCDPAVGLHHPRDRELGFALNLYFHRFTWQYEPFFRSGMSSLCPADRQKNHAEEKHGDAASAEHRQTPLLYSGGPADGDSAFSQPNSPCTA